MKYSQSTSSASSGMNKNYWRKFHAFSISPIRFQCNVIELQGLATSVIELKDEGEDGSVTKPLTQNLAHIVTVLPNLMQPTFDINEGLGVCHIVNNDDTMGVPVIPAQKKMNFELRK